MRTASVAALFGGLVIGVANASILPEIPTSILDPPRSALQSKRTALQLRLDAYNAITDQFNASCGSVPTDSAQAQRCRQEQVNLQTQKASILAAVNEFKQQLKCGELKSQLERDQAAMKVQMRSIAQGQQEMEEWSKERKHAEKEALQHAFNFLVNSLTAGAEGIAEEKLEEVEAAFKKRLPEGETWRRKLEKVAELRRREAKYSAISDGIKVANLAVPASEAVIDLQEKARDAANEAQGIDAIINEISSDPEGKEIVREAGLKTVLEVLKTQLPKWLSPNVVTSADFLADYGYDITKWEASGNRIKQQIALRDKDLAAINALKAQIERSTAKLKTANCSE